MKILVAQINPTIGDLEGNTQKVLQVLDRARMQHVDVVLFPELTICGYPPGDFLFHSSFIDSMELYLSRIVRASSKLMVLVGLVRRNLEGGEKGLLNSAAVIQNGKLLGFYDKWLLPNYNVFDERRYFEPGQQLPIWTYKGKKIAVIICEDIWQHAGYTESVRYPRDPILDLVPHKPDVLLNLSASPYQFQKPDTRVQVCAKAARTLGCPVILCCQVGGNDQLVFDGYSLFVDAKGNLAQLAAGFEEDEMIVDLEAPIASHALHYDPLHDLYHALVLGLKDYFHKLGFKKACLGLSGGVDSALTACIAVDALGVENVLGVSMPSHITAAMSKRDAQQLAENLGIEFCEIPIYKIYEEFTEALKPHFMGKAPFDVTEENLQSRIRAMLLMALSNKLGYIVLSTGNKSELGMGYCTLYGDMCGGFGPIADVLKTQVYALARWVNREKEIIPLSTIEKPPSAELRPNQRDQDSLPDYTLLDTVLQAYVEDYLSPQEIATKYKIPIEQVLDLVQRIHRAEFKRAQSAPTVRVSKKAFRVGRRYPIVQGWV